MNSLIFKRVELMSRRVPRPVRPLLYAVGGVLWLLGPPLAFLALMTMASLATWGIAWVVYDYKGRPQNYEWRAQRNLAAQVANVLQPQRTNRVYFLGLPLDLPEDRFLQTLQQRYRWESVGEGAMQLNEKVGMTYSINERDVVTRAQVTSEGIDEQQIIGLIGRCMAIWGNPLATAEPIGITNRAFEAISWQDDRAIVAFDFVPMRGRQNVYRMHLSVISEADPQYQSRRHTHGFPPVYRHLEELNKNIEDRAQGIVPVPGPGLGLGQQMMMPGGVPAQRVQPQRAQPQRPQPQQPQRAEPSR